MTAAALSHRAPPLMSHSERAFRRRDIAEAVRSGEPVPAIVARWGVSIALVRAAHDALHPSRSRQAITEGDLLCGYAGAPATTAADSGGRAP